MLFKARDSPHNEHYGEGHDFATEKYLYQATIKWRNVSCVDTVTDIEHFLDKQKVHLSF